MIKFVSALALIASMAERAQADPALAEIEAYITTQNAITNHWERSQDCDFEDAAEVVHVAGSKVDDTSYGDGGTINNMAFVHIPKSGWALKKYPTVKSWVNDEYYGGSAGGSTVTWD